MAADRTLLPCSLCGRPFARTQLTRHHCLPRAEGGTQEDVESAYDGRGYGDLKTDVGEAVVELFAPMQERLSP